MLYTGKGDDGTTKTFGCDQRISKSSAIAEALGSLDEINSFLGFCKIKSKKYGVKFSEELSFEKIVYDVQKNLFIIQAEVAGSEMHIAEAKVKDIEKIINDIEKELPPIKSFFISGGTKLAVLFDISRTIARRAERRVVEVSEEGKTKISDFSKAYLNRLSSLLYALARLTNHKFGIKEDSPDYK
ncbi:MAG: cob(I)yrinic acid a,c-diamide adenosyltransferase [Candidatus Paceibacterota bacterium]|jgi:cob(I)alamin adenosyltransferase